MPHTNDASAASSGSNGQSTIGEAIYALTDEQILDIDDAEVAPPPGDAGTQQGVILSEGDASASSRQAGKDQRPGVSASRDDSTDPAVSDHASERANRAVDSSGPSTPQNDTQTRPTHESPATSHQSPITSHESPPEWLAQAMNDPQQGGPARQFWESAQQTRAQAAQLASLDRAYFGAPGAPHAQLAESREALAQQLLREDPAAFREMLAAGLRALQQQDVILSEGDASASSGQAGKDQRPGVPASKDERISTAHESRITNHESRLAHYAAFERAANDDLDRAVRPEIARVLERALPAGNNEPARATQERLSGLVRTEIESALRQDRALGEQVAQLLGSRTFDDATRAQVVRLIAARATSLVPVASRRVLAEWTQSALAAHRAGRSLTGATDAARNPSSSPATAASPASSAAKPRPSQSAALGTQHAGSRRINYRALSDEEILDL
jgi:hypothetical protein